MNKRATPTPDVKKPGPLPLQPPELSGGNVRGEVAGCPTGLTDGEQPSVVQRSDDGDVPATGAGDLSVPLSPGEGVTAQQIEKPAEERAD